MPKFFVKNNQIKNNKITIEGEDVNHIVNVLRMKQQDEIQICDLDSGNNYLSEILEYNKEQVLCQVKEKLENCNETKIDITLFQGIPKFDKMEWIIQKNTEIGVKKIVPVNMVRCVAKIKDNNKIERWNKIAAIAAKQSMRNMIPTIKNPISINTLCDELKLFDIIFLAYEGEENNTLKAELRRAKQELANNEVDNNNYRIGIIIGPEGGIDSKEVENISQCDNVKIVTLGKRILRTETAGLVLASNIIYELED